MERSIQWMRGLATRNHHDDTSHRIHGHGRHGSHDMANAEWDLTEDLNTWALEEDVGTLRRMQIFPTVTSDTLTNPETATPKVNMDPLTLNPSLTPSSNANPNDEMFTEIVSPKWTSHKQSHQIHDSQSRKHSSAVGIQSPGMHNSTGIKTPSSSHSQYSHPQPPGVRSTTRKQQEKHQQPIRSSAPPLQSLSSQTPPAQRSQESARQGNGSPDHHSASEVPTIAEDIQQPKASAWSSRERARNAEHLPEPYVAEGIESGEGVPFMISNVMSAVSPDSLTAFVGRYPDNVQQDNVDPRMESTHAARQPFAFAHFKRSSAIQPVPRSSRPEPEPESERRLIFQSLRYLDSDYMFDEGDVTEHGEEFEPIHLSSIAMSRYELSDINALSIEPHIRLELVRAWHVNRLLMAYFVIFTLCLGCALAYTILSYTNWSIHVDVGIHSYFAFVNLPDAYVWFTIGVEICCLAFISYLTLAMIINLIHTRKEHRFVDQYVVIILMIATFLNVFPWKGYEFLTIDTRVYWDESASDPDAVVSLFYDEIDKSLPDAIFTAILPVTWMLYMLTRSVAITIPPSTIPAARRSVLVVADLFAPASLLLCYLALRLIATTCAYIYLPAFLLSGLLITIACLTFGIGDGGHQVAPMTFSFIVLFTLLEFIIFGLCLRGLYRSHRRLMAESYIATRTKRLMLLFFGINTITYVVLAFVLDFVTIFANYRPVRAAFERTIGLTNFSIQAGFGSYAVFSTLYACLECYVILPIDSARFPFCIWFQARKAESESDDEISAQEDALGELDLEHQSRQDVAEKAEHEEEKGCLGKFRHANGIIRKTNGLADQFSKQTSHRMLLYTLYPPPSIHKMGRRKRSHAHRVKYPPPLQGMDSIFTLSWAMDMLNCCFLSYQYGVPNATPPTLQEVKAEDSWRFVKHIWDDEFDTHVVILEQDDKIVVAFRGTKSGKNIQTDIQATRVSLHDMFVRLFGTDSLAKLAEKLNIDPLVQSDQTPQYDGNFFFFSRSSELTSGSQSAQASTVVRSAPGNDESASANRAVPNPTLAEPQPPTGLAQTFEAGLESVSAEHHIYSMMNSMFNSGKSYLETALREVTRHMKIHEGFAVAYEKVCLEVLFCVIALVKASDRPVFFTGHSLGGALASIAAFNLSLVFGQQEGPSRVACWTFGSPKVGNRHFAEQFHKHVKASWRVAMMGDPIPRIPPGYMGYKHCDTAVLLSLDGELLIDPVPIERMLLGQSKAVFALHRLWSYRIALELWIEKRHPTYAPHIWHVGDIPIQCKMQFPAHFNLDHESDWGSQELERQWNTSMVDGMVSTPDDAIFENPTMGLHGSDNIDDPSPAP